MKKLRINYRLALFSFLAIIGLYFGIESVLAPPSPNLIADYNEIDLFHACSYYKLQYSGTLIQWMYNMVTLNISKLNSVVGNFSANTSWLNWEWKINKTYNETIPNCTTVCELYNATKNGTYTKANCTEICNPYNQTSWKYEWMKNTPTNLNTYGSQLYQNTVNNGYTEIRFCSDIKRQQTENGYEIRLDHIPSFGGTDYPNYQWWNNSYSSKRQQLVNQTGTSTLTNYPYIVNGTNGFVLNTEPSQFVWSVDNVTSTNTTYNYLYYNSFSDYVISNGSENTQLPVEIESGNGTAYQNTSVWDNNFLGVYHFSKNGTNLTDSTQYAKHGILINGSSGGLPVWTSGKYAGGMNFTNSSKQYVNLTGLTLPTTGPNRTLEAWVLVRGKGSEQNVVDNNRGPTGGGDIMQMGSDGTFYIYCGDLNNGETTYLQTNWSPNLNQWYYLVVRYVHWSNNIVNISFWVNGTMQSSKNSTANQCDGSNSAFTICKSTTNDVDYCYMQIDEVRISNISRDDDYIKRNWNMGLSNLGPIQTQSAFTYSLNSTNSTTAGTPILHSLNWTDNVALSGYIFSFYNGSNSTTAGSNTTIFYENFAGWSTTTACDGASASGWSSCVATGTLVWRKNATSAGATMTGVNATEPSMLEGNDIDKGTDVASLVKCIDATPYSELYVGVSFGANGLDNGEFINLTVNKTGNGFTNLWGVQGTSGVVGMSYSEFNATSYISSYTCFNITVIGANLGTDRAFADDFRIIGRTLTTIYLVNDTWVAFSGTWSNITKVVNSTPDTLIQWCVYANDSSNNWNGTSCTNPFSYLTTSPTGNNASFSLAMPSTYSWTTIIGTSEGSATTLTWISFNFTDIPQNFVQPFTSGSSSNAQNGNATPIFWINNIGNVNTNISLRFSTALPSGISVMANVSCNGTYTSCNNTLSTLGTTYTQIITLLNPNSFANITLYANVSSGTLVSANNGGYSLYINSTGDS